MRKYFVSIFLVMVFSLAVSGLVWADDYIEPHLVKVSTPFYHPMTSDFKPVLGTYTYTVSWQGISAATVDVQVEQEGLYYHLMVKAKTYSGIDIFYKLRYRAEGMISAVDYSPLRTVIEQKENSKERFTEIEFLEDGQVKALRRTKGEDPKVLQFDPQNFMLEPFSAAFLARSLPWYAGETKFFDTFNGKSRYLITLTALERTQVQVNNEIRDVWVISPKVENLTNPNASKKLREAKIYVSADEKREILQIVSSVFVGSVKTKLVSFTPSQRVHGTVVAQRKGVRLVK